MRAAIIFLFVFIGNGLFSQEVKTIEHKNQKMDMFMVQVNHESLLNAPKNLKISALSRGVSLSLMYDHIMSKNVSIGVGVGFTSRNYFHEAQFSVIPDTFDDHGTYTLLEPLANGNSFSKNKIATNYVDFPVELRFRTKPNEKGHSWVYAVGVRTGYRTNLYTKTIDKDGKKLKNYSIPNLSRSTAGLTARVGYGKVGINCFYSMLPMIYENRGANYSALSIGISISFF